MNTYDQLVLVTARQITENPDITDAQLLGYIEYLGVFVPQMRDHILQDAKKSLK